jgi:chemotaxis protein CheD
MRVEDTTEQNRVEAERERAARVRAMKEITVGLADCRISNDPASVLVTHALGSCVAVAIHDPVAGVAGLLHLMLPESALDPAKAAVRPYQFADTGIPLMFHAAYALGAEKKRMSVRLVGGAQVLDPVAGAAAGAPKSDNLLFNIGKRNHLACRKILWAAGVMIHGEAVGGTISRTVRLEPDGGRLWYTTPGSPAQEIAVRKGGAS